MEQKYKYMVATRCFTFNHAPYIEDALRGFAMQETTFPTLFLVIDDSSTDGEQEILRSWAENNLSTREGCPLWRRMPYGDVAEGSLSGKSNVTFAILLLAENHNKLKKPKLPYLIDWLAVSKYHALCEGDDWWIDSGKLQKQVLFLESHPEHSLCFCSHQEYYPDGHLAVVKRYENNIEQCPMEDIIAGSGGYMATCSMVFVGDRAGNYPDWAKGTPVGDLPLMLLLASRGHVGYLSDTMCTYRLSSTGSWNYRVARSRDLQEKHYKGSIKMWKGFDTWTDHRYHKIVKQVIRSHKKAHLRLMLLYYIKYQFKK